ncbi:DNA ligase D [Aquabacterium sp.]|uniref:DNA ligase D n=1 Tax=Aquabacterium sp. TaxID=1872578 RepID=UPI002CBECBB1|nr:DNA ligase D [Aquabacterium sp.]HSW04814.1 DNA ligase D [Aquabacterium sp.]
MPVASTRRAAAPAPLRRYHAKRDFKRTPEPRAEAAAPNGDLAFVVQKHHASHLHYDFRLELDGVLLSWAVPKGPSLDPADKRLAVHVEDHPLAYRHFEGTIPPGQYGAGQVQVWDQGRWTPVGGAAQARRGVRAGKLEFDLSGHKLRGRWELVRMAPKKTGDAEAWLLFKKRDAWARPRADYDVLAAEPGSVLGAAAQALPPASTREAGSAGKTRQHALPTTLSPQLAVLATQVPTGGDWRAEMKFDGYRLLARITHGRARLFTRSGQDWTRKLEPLAAALARLPVDEAWLDGEIVVNGPDGRPEFNRLQNAFDAGRTEAIVYWLFDLPLFGGEDLREQPLLQRRRRLRELLADVADGPLRFSEDLPGEISEALQAACGLQLEGLIVKRQDAPYVSRRSDSWLKLKCGQRQEFVIGGFTERSDSAQAVGALLLGQHDDAGHLRPVGRVGTGFSQAAARTLHRQLAALEVTRTPFADPPDPRQRHRRSDAAPHWVRPQLVAQVRFASWTPDGNIRHAVFQGLRSDKPARQVGAEQRSEPQSPSQPKSPQKSQRKPQRASPAQVGALAISHPDRVIDKHSGLRKIDLVRFYEQVAGHLLPQLAGRPVALLRAPAGVGGAMFFQKHAEGLRIPGLRVLDAALWPEHEALIEVASVEALIGAAQMNVIEFHPWNATTRRIDQPNRLVLDLDPGEGVAWPQVREAAQLVRTLLDELGLRCWLKTSGGKGLHLVLPIAPRWSADTVKAFSRAIVQHLAKTVPSRFVATSGPSNRVGRIFVDYLRNGLGATTVAAYSARARPGLGVSMPIGWDALADLASSAQWTVADTVAHLRQRGADPWGGLAACRQGLGEAMRRLGFAAEADASTTA